MFGQQWRRMIRGGVRRRPRPRRRARSGSTARGARQARDPRPPDDHEGDDDVADPGPSMAATRIARISSGNANMMSAPAHEGRPSQPAIPGGDHAGPGCRRVSVSKNREGDEERDARADDPGGAGCRARGGRRQGGAPARAAAADREEVGPRTPWGGATAGRRPPPDDEDDQQRRRGGVRRGEEAAPASEPARLRKSGAAYGARRSRCVRPGRRRIQVDHGIEQIHREIDASVEKGEQQHDRHGHRIVAGKHAWIAIRPRPGMLKTSRPRTCP